MKFTPGISQRVAGAVHVTSHVRGLELAVVLKPRKSISQRQTCCMSCLGVSRRGCDNDAAGAGDAVCASAGAGSAAVAKSGSGAVVLELPCGEPKGPMPPLPDAAAMGDTATVGAGAGVLVGSRGADGDGDGPRPAMIESASRHRVFEYQDSP